MKALISSLIGLMLSISVSAEPLIEGRVRLESGEPVADAQVQIFDLSDLRRGPMARAQTDGTGYFALPLAALTGSVLPARFTLGQTELPQSVQSLDDHSLSPSSFVRGAARGVQPTRAAHCDIGGWGAGGGLSHGDVVRYRCGWSRRRGGGLCLPDDGGHGEPDRSDGAD